MWWLLGVLTMLELFLLLAVIGMAIELKKRGDEHERFVEYNRIEVYPRYNKSIERIERLEERDEFYHGDEDIEFDDGGSTPPIPTAH